MSLRPDDWNCLQEFNEAIKEVRARIKAMHQETVTEEEVLATQTEVDQLIAKVDLRGLQDHKGPQYSDNKKIHHTAMLAASKYLRDKYQNIGEIVPLIVEAFRHEYNEFISTTDSGRLHVSHDEALTMLCNLQVRNAVARENLCKIMSALTDPGVEPALLTARDMAKVMGQDIPGDVEGMIIAAFTRHFRRPIPEAEAPGYAAKEQLVYVLQHLPPIETRSRVLIDRAIKTLTEGPILSMNVELEEGQDLPVAMHTLLQGTLWALLLASGADPDIGRTETIAQKHRINYSQSDKLIWFMCKKFFFTRQVAEKDGVTVHSVTQASPGKFTVYSHRIYAGRFFYLAIFWRMGFVGGVHKYSWGVMPPVVSAYGLGTQTVLLNTTKRLYGMDLSEQFVWNDRKNHRPSNQTINPNRLTFANCPDIVKYTKSLPAWSKHELVSDVLFTNGLCLILTPVGTAAAGTRSKSLVGPLGTRLDMLPLFHMVSFPDGFTPDMALVEDDSVVFMQDDQHLILALGN
ncbi:hypothetical protein J8273_6027 [Carpediemonas membranifera]|uniref:Uncharacterized protein n=1 Tax=Carpediemonas membranifera TaxID=201153 RepID=A0A8J6B261_9EUKA|nr:hypothetical protein J8273_6027 [Carpediemonas membranifera]|eukprot:KAG9392659.1 hypothetical protein J8273_6027 [Carpediemonas membranifera]